jgi:signal transduction histidine kinase
MRLLFKRPSFLLQLLWLGCLAACAATAWLALQEPWLGVRMAVDGDKLRVVVDYSQQITPGAEVRRVISATGSAVELLPLDLTENLDSFASYLEKDKFFAKQSAMDAMLRMSKVSLVWLDKNNAEHITSITPRPRPLASLSAMFWFTLFVVSTAFMISCWVYLLSPKDWGARMFALTGLTLLMGGISGALISERALALDGAWFSQLDNFNSLSGQAMGGAILAMFLSFPRALVAPRTLWWIPALFFPLWLANTLHLLPDSREPMLAISVQMILAFIIAAVQWRHTRGQPLERAALRWFVLSVLLGCSLFSVTNIVPLLFDQPALLPMGYAIGFFLIMYVGIALGLSRYRLFDIDEWAYRVFLWVAGATSVIALDMLLIFTGVTEGASLGISLLLCGWLYFPFRQWLWERLVGATAPKFDNLLPELSAIAFIAAANEQQARWEALLRRIFDPLEFKQSEQDKAGGVREEGLGLAVPGCGNLPAYMLRYAGRGTKLFSSRDALFAASLSQLLQQIMSGRTSYEQGVTQERLRLGRDLHDNIGARLLKLIHHLRGTPDADVARDAMKDLRTAIAAMDSRPVPLSNALADWRAEAGSRCEAADCRLHWQQSEALPDIELPPRKKAMLESVIRELVTNALKHAAPSSIKVEIDVNGMQLKAVVENDGSIADPLAWRDGYGLRNIRGRLEELGGGLSISSAGNKVQMTIETPLI